MEAKLSGCDKKSVKVVFACSGTADVGELSDLVARKLQKKMKVQMKCLASVGAGVPEMIDSIRGAKILVIDGCSKDCGKLILCKNEISDFTHLRLTELGYTKGATLADAHNVDAVYEVASALL
ncbi:MAG: zinc-binding protein [Bacteroidales bacterium]|nr:putative zinc-binding protein [Labilibaculum sp.]PCH67323.1 MAG: zinc-binding protein [Bacteroidales bacterium]